MADNSSHSHDTNQTLQRVLDQRYQLQDHLGTGGMARVYKATDTALERTVAIKVLHDHLAEDAMLRTRFEREAKFIASFNHPNVIQIFDYATTKHDGKHICHMVMTYLPGKTLKDIMDDLTEQAKIMPQAQFIDIMKDIAAALDYAHEQGMVHRDIKPANILFNERGQAVLTDFGIARMMESSSRLTQENVAVGTPAYMAPEQAAGETVTPQTDIYALGIIAYEILAGTPPFGDDGSISILIKHINEPVPLLSKFAHIQNDFLDPVVLKALEKKPEKRYASAGQFVADLERAITNNQPLAAQAHSTTTTPVGLGMITTTESTRTRGNSPLGILIAGLSLIIVVLVFAFVNTNNTPIAAVPTIEQPTLPTATATLDPADFRRFGGLDSMVEEPESVPSMTSSDNEPFSTQFNPDDTHVAEHWPLGESAAEGISGALNRSVREDGTYAFTSTVRNRASTSVLQGKYYTTDITIETTLTLDPESPTNSGYGIVFHHVSEQNFGVFAVDGAGRFSIWFLEDGQWRELRGLDERWTEDNAVNLVGEANMLQLDIRGTTLIGYVNGVEVVQLDDPGLIEGAVGLYLATPNRENISSTITADNFSVAIADETTTSSMTE